MMSPTATGTTAVRKRTRKTLVTRRRCVIKIGLFAVGALFFGGELFLPGGPFLLNVISGLYGLQMVWETVKWSQNLARVRREGPFEIEETVRGGEDTPAIRRFRKRVLTAFAAVLAALLAVGLSLAFSHVSHRVFERAYWLCALVICAPFLGYVFAMMRLLRAETVADRARAEGLTRKTTAETVTNATAQAGGGGSGSHWWTQSSLRDDTSDSATLRLGR